MNIAFDAATNGTSVNPGTSLTWSHTIAQAGEILFVCTRGGNGEGDKISGVTYAGVAMTQIATVTIASSNQVVSLYYLLAPAIGANNVVVSLSSGFLIGGSVSYKDVRQSGQPDASTTKNVSATTSMATTVTSVADKCWTILAAITNGGGLIAGSGSTQRLDLTNGANPFIVFDSNAAITPAGSTSMTVSWSGNSEGASIMASFAPAPDAGGLFLTNFT